MSFNPTEVRLEADHDLGVQGIRACASTPQRFVWKWAMRSMTALRSRLQPHRGSSGRPRCGCGQWMASGFNPTEVRLEVEEMTRDLYCEELQPHRGSSGSRDGVGAGPREYQLQPHRGSSGRRTIGEYVQVATKLQPHRGSSGSLGRAVQQPSCRRASTPQRFVWKVVGRRLEALDRDRFNPTEVRLEAVSSPGGSSLSELQPHRGSSGRTSGSGSGRSPSQLQPHRGSSGSRRPSRQPSNSRRFNPTEVRLEERALSRLR